MFKNIPWKNWKTRKITLMFSIFAVIAYTVTDIVLTIKGTPLDAVLTEQVFIYFTALPVTGCAITIAKVVKGKTNTDIDEIHLESKLEEEIDFKREESDEVVEEVESEDLEDDTSENIIKPERIVKGELL